MDASPRIEPGTKRSSEAKLRQEVDARLARIEGQVRGIRNMTFQGRRPVEILTQITAVRAGLKRIADLAAADHVRRCAESAAARTAEEPDIEALYEGVESMLLEMTNETAPEGVFP